MPEVERQTTPLNSHDLGENLVFGHKLYFGKVPSPARLAVAWAHCALEHARGELLYNFNFGNVTAGAKWEGDFYVMHVPPPDPPVLKFRAFAKPELGAEDYWDMLDQHYRPALLLFDWGRAFDAAMLLGKLGYYTANKERYATAVGNLKDYFDRFLAAAFVDELGEGKGNSVLSQEEIDATLGSVSDTVMQEIRDRPTDPDLIAGDTTTTTTTDGEQDELEPRKA